MRILTLSQWYVPEPDFKIHALGQDLAARGHHVTALTGFPNYPQGRVYPGYRQRLRQWEERNGVHVLRVPLYPDHSRSSAKRIINYASFALSAATVGAASCGQADVMWVYHPPLTVGIPAWWIGWLRQIPYIYEVQDMWPETLAATGMALPGQAEKLLAHLARFVYRNAAAITVISPGFKRNLIGKGVPAEKIHVFPNWADESIYRPVPRNQQLGEEYGLAGRFNIVFGGNMGAAQVLENVLHAAGILKDVPDLQFVFIGDGIDAERLQQRARELRLKNVCFVERQPAAKMADFFAWGDGLLVHLKDDPLFEITIPSKTIAYLACGRPIICAVRGDAADTVQSAHAGLVCTPEDAQALADAVHTLYNMPPDRREAMGNSGRATFLAQYTRSSLVARYEELLAAVANDRRSSRRKRQ